MKAMKKIVSCIAVSSLLGLTATQTMATDQQARNESKAAANRADARNNLTDSQIIKVVSTANNGEVKQAKTALPKLKNEEARNFANIMIKEHTANERQGQALASRLNLTPQASGISTALQKDSDNVVRKLTQSSTPDKDYMTSQVEVHQKVLDTIDKQLIPNAKNAQLKNMLTQTRAAVAKHLQTAEQIVAKMK